MRILLTGASGFIGGAIARLLSEKHEVLATIRPGSTPPPNCTPVICDLAQDGAWNLLPVDVVVHAAQSRRYKEFPAGAADVFAVNVASTQKLLQYAAQNAVKHVCLLSSVSVYEPDYKDMNESAALAPTSQNGASKLAAEMLTQPFRDLFPISILRLAFPYGPGQTQRLISNLIERVEKGEPVDLAGPDGSRFAALYVDDIAAVVAQAIEQNWSGVFNVAGPQALSMRAFVNLIGAALNKEPLFETSPQPAIDFVPPLDKLTEKVDASRFTSPKTGLAKTVRAFSSTRQRLTA